MDKIPGVHPGVQMYPAGLGDLRKVLRNLTAADIGALDSTLGGWLERPLGREALAGVVLPASGSPYVGDLSGDPAGVIVFERGDIGVRIRALAVARDLRKRGVARSLLAYAGVEVRARNLEWLWMSIASDNTPAIRCALNSGFRRLRPQCMRRERRGALAFDSGSLRLEPLAQIDAAGEFARWHAFEADAGDRWCAELVQADLLKWLAPADGTYLHCLQRGREVGLLHMRGDDDSAQITLWLEQSLWGGVVETAALKAALDRLRAIPSRIDVFFGSGDHLRASAPRLKALGFTPRMRERMLFVKHLVAPAHPKDDI